MKRFPELNDVIAFDTGRSAGREYIVIQAVKSLTNTSGSSMIRVLPASSADRATGLIDESSAKNVVVYLDAPVAGLAKTVKQYKLTDVVLMGTVTLKKNTTYAVVSRKDVG